MSRGCYLRFTRVEPPLPVLTCNLFSLVLIYDHDFHAAVFHLARFSSVTILCLEFFIKEDEGYGCTILDIFYFNQLINCCHIVF